MPKYEFRVWTGPTLVAEIAGYIRKAGYEAQEGTEHVYGLVAEGSTPEGAAHNFLVDVEKYNDGQSFGLNPEKMRQLQEMTHSDMEELGRRLFYGGRDRG